MSCIKKFNLNPYRILGINSSIVITLEELRKIYEQKIEIVHPENTNKNTLLEFQLLKESLYKIKRFRKIWIKY
jgi:hypothetical protein